MGNVESAPSLLIDFSALIADDGASEKESETLPRPPSKPTLSPKGSSFLEEPVTRRVTEQGEATVNVSSTEIYSAGREGLADGSGRMRYAVSEMQGWRSHMEDRHCLNPPLFSNRQQKELLKDHHLFAVFDGHGGDFASYFCGEYFTSTLVRQREWRSYLKLMGRSTTSNMDSVKGVSLLKSALVAAFLNLDARLMDAQRDRRVSQLSQLEKLVHSLGGMTCQHDIFKEGTDDRHRVMNFDRTLPPSTMPANIPLERSGSTGVVVLITPTHIICANAGDSRAILSKRTNQVVLSEDGVLPLSFDHKPDKDVEEARVRKDGGFVRAGRVDGDLAVSRSFGDFGFKNRLPEAREDEASTSWNANGSDRTVSTVSTCSTTTSATNDCRITVRPDILVHKREPSRDEFVILACDGIWDRLSNRACADIVRSLIHDEGETDAGLICEEVIDTALELDSRDNMTCCVAVFPGAGMGGEEARLLRGINGAAGGVMERRRQRESTWGDSSTPAKRAHARLEERMRRNREATAHHNVQAMMRQARRKHQTLQLSASQEGGSPRGRSSRKHGAALSRSPKARTRKQHPSRGGVKGGSRSAKSLSEGLRRSRVASVQ